MGIEVSDVDEGLQPPIMLKGQERGATPYFEAPDIDEYYYRRFNSVWQGGNVYADPSGWTETYSDAARLLPYVRHDSNDLGRYYLDEGKNLSPHKDTILGLLSSWENFDLSLNEVTLYNSVSTASAATLILLKELGIQNIIFETPAYPVTVNQAQFFGLQAYLVPTYLRDHFQFSLSREVIERRSPCAIWITQPRMSLGIDQEVDDLDALIDSLSSVDALVIDEATEQRFPSVTSTLLRHKDITSSPTIIRIRGLLKGVGLNGIRLAAIIHPKEMRGNYESVQEVLGSSLDLFSLRAAESIATDISQFRLMLKAANDQAVSLRRKVDSLAIGAPIRVAKLENGYMGSLAIELKDLAPTGPKAREIIYSILSEARIPVISGPCMYFAVDPKWEHIRLNYFSFPHHLIRTISTLSSEILRAI